MQPMEITEVLSRPISRELLARDITRLAYTANDGTPRNVPIGFAWNGSEIVMCTPKNAPKLWALAKTAWSGSLSPRHGQSSSTSKRLCPAQSRSC